MGEDTLEESITESFGMEEGRRRRLPAAPCEGEGEGERERKSFGWVKKIMRERRRKEPRRSNRY
jgi:hypothetical protein